MAIIVSKLLFAVETSEDEVVAAALKRCRLPFCEDVSASIWKRAIDARHKNVLFSWSVRISLKNADAEQDIVKTAGGDDVRYRPETKYDPEITAERRGAQRPVIVGFGPAGMFAALLLAEKGYAPIVLERGGNMDERDEKTAALTAFGRLDPDTNIQFGEGGAGAYSDGKLLTRIGDERCEHVLKTLAKFGAPSEILARAKPHVGTDELKPMVKAIRKRIIDLGGELRFNCRMKELLLHGGRVAGISTCDGDIPADTVILATGHSARDTFLTLCTQGIQMEQKAFSMGIRAEHSQRKIDEALYGKYAGNPLVGAAEYHLAYKPDKKSDEAVYSFCMCPGGRVVAAASEHGGVTTNGMSFYARDGKNANSAIVAAVPTRYFPSGSPMAGIELQRETERRAFAAGGGEYRAPACMLGEFFGEGLHNGWGGVMPTYLPGVRHTSIIGVLPDFVTAKFGDAFRYFARCIKGFDSADTVFTAPETRTSSPIRISRGENMQSVSTPGLFPCGEGAGYAGGIISSAVDGLRAAERVLETVKPI